MSVAEVRDWGLTSLLYVSRSTLAIEGDDKEVAEIVDVATARNGSLNITGALIYTEQHFAQVLEGPIKGVRELMNSILRDKRHRDVTVVVEQKISARKFPRWAMAYSGAFPYLDRQIKPLLSPTLGEADRLRLGHQLIANIEQLQTDAKNG